MSISDKPLKINIPVIILAILGLILGISLVLYSKTAKTKEKVEFVKSSKKIDHVPSYESNTVVKSEVFASKTGKKYYFSGCSGLKRIKKENLISFPDPGAAEKAGLTLAANCKAKEEIK